MKEHEFIGLVIEDKYRLDRKIGEGGMGAVYLGTQLMVDRHVAIKLLHSGLSAHERVKQRFEVEAKAIGRMHHPNCITLFDFGFSPQLRAFYMVMEYLEGTPMHERVQQGVKATEAVEIARQVALALDHAHHQGILHRDLKPENVMLTRMTDGSELTKVLDFGIARIFSQDDTEGMSSQEQNRLTRAGEIFGTPAYISPEQARGERHLTPASDLYSLGVMLFEMLTGELPFWGETAMDTIMKHIADPVPPINRLDISRELKQVTQRMLSKDPSERPQSGKELVIELDAILMQRKQAEMHASTRPTSPIPSPFAAADAPPHSAATHHPTLIDPSFGGAPSPPTTPPTAPAEQTNLSLSSSDLDEWATSEATVVRSSAEMLAFARSPAAPTPPRSAAPRPVATDPPYSDLPEPSTWRSLPLIAAALMLMIAAGVVLFLTFNSSAEERGAVPSAEISSATTPAAPLEHPGSLTHEPAEPPPSPPLIEEQDPPLELKADPGPLDPDFADPALSSPSPPDDPKPAPVKPQAIEQSASAQTKKSSPRPRRSGQKSEKRAKPLPSLMLKDTTERTTGKKALPLN